MKRIMFISSLLVILIVSVFLINCICSVAYISSESIVCKTVPNIIIDCGHGGEDGGAVSSKGLVEKDVNLQIGLALERFMKQGGFNVEMIRTTDTAVYDSSATTLREKKISDIHNRTDIVNKSENNILISIHQNKFEQSQYYGTQVFYSKGSDKSKELAECIRLAVQGLLQNDNERQCKAATKDIYILHNATVPAVLVECGFLSNPQEESKLRTELYRNQMAFCIYSGFLEYYYQNY